MAHMSQNGICVDLFVFPSGFVDLATIGALASTTGGAIYRYPFFKTGADTTRVRCMTSQPHSPAQVASDLRKIIKNMRGVEGMLRVRCSTGVAIGCHRQH